MWVVACSKTPALETCIDSVWYFIGFNADYLLCKGVCHDSQTVPLDAPLIAGKYRQIARSDQDNQLLWHTESNSRQKKLNEIEYMLWEH